MYLNLANELINVNIDTDEQWASKVIDQILGKAAYGIFVTRKLPSELNFSYRCIYTAHRNDEGVTVIGQDIGIENYKTEYDCLLLFRR